jgi:hypothetical protein
LLRSIPHDVHGIAQDQVAVERQVVLPGAVIPHLSYVDVVGPIDLDRDPPRVKAGVEVTLPAIAVATRCLPRRRRKVREPAQRQEVQLPDAV